MSWKRFGLQFLTLVVVIVFCNVLFKKFFADPDVGTFVITALGLILTVIIWTLFFPKK